MAALGAQPLVNFKDYRALAQEFKFLAKANLPADVRIADVFVGWYHVLAVTTESFSSPGAEMIEDSWGGAH